MDLSELAAKMLEWEKTKKALELIEEEIAAAVMQIGKTQTVGNVRATYSGGTRTFDYETAGKDAPAEIIAQHTQTKIITDWKSVCKSANIESIPFTISDPSVKVKFN